MKGYTSILMVLLVLFIVPIVSAQTVLVTPEEAEVEPSTGVQFQAQLFSENAQLIPVEKFTWKVEPESLGTISEDGFFIAAPQPGEGEVIALVEVNGQTFGGRALITVGRRPHPLIRVIVIPKEVVVPPGGKVLFRARLVSPIAVPMPVRFKWKVKPERLGKITQEGLFTAGNRIGDGRVIASVEIAGRTYSGFAYVVVGPKPSGAISGTVVRDDTGSPIANVRITAHRIGRIRWKKRALTNESGSYLIENLIPGFYVVRASAQGFISEFYDDVRYLNEATPVTVAPFDTTENIDFGLSTGGSISGWVFADEDSSALEAAHLIAHLVVNPKVKQHVLSNEDGTYTIGGLASGVYIVEARKDGYVREFYDDVPNWNEATFITVTEPEDMPNIDFGLATKSAIAGTVTSAFDGSPIVGAWIEARSLLAGTNTRMIFKRVRTDDDGKYLMGLPPGFYIVRAEARGYITEYYDNVRKPDEAKPVQVFEDRHTTGIDFALDPLGSISGKVVSDENGSPIAGAIVVAFLEEHRDRPHRAMTADDGTYTIHDLKAGKYLVRASAEGFLPEFFDDAQSPKDATLVTVEDSHDTPDINFRLAKGGVISGTVVSDVDSSAISGALVRVRRLGWDFHKHSLTNDDGSYAVTGLPTGYYIVQASARGYVSEYYDNAHAPWQASLVHVVAPNEVTDIDFSLAPKETFEGSIAGKITSESDGSPIYGASVFAIPKGGGRPQVAISDPEGDYLITGLRSGYYYVLAWAFGHIGEFYDNVTDWRDATPVEVISPQLTANIDFVLTPQSQGAYSISGRIISATDTAPLEGVFVYARSRQGERSFGVTDKDGKYLISGLTAGSYTVRAAKVGYESRCFGGRDESNATPVTVGNGQNAENVDLQMPSASMTGVDEQNESPHLVPDSFELSQNYPNPFNPGTEIKYQLPEAAHVTIRVFNVLGQQICTLVDEKEEAGFYKIYWNAKDGSGRDVASGIYFYQMKAQSMQGKNFTQIRRMTLLR